MSFDHHLEGPPPERLYFPSGLAHVDVPGKTEGVLFVANANSDKRYATGSLVALPLDSIGLPEIGAPLAVSASGTSFVRQITDLKLEASQNVQIASFAGELAVQTTGTGSYRLYVPTRSEGMLAYQVLAKVSADGVPVCYGTGTFMVLEPPPGVALYSMSHRKETDPPIAPLAERELKRDEKKVLAIADAALAEMRAGGNFIKSFWGVKTHARHTGAGGAVGALNNSPHVGNRVGHLQGGVTMGLGVATAETALPANWMLSAVTAWYIRPGEGRVIKANSKIIHQGRLTAVVRTEITGKNNKRVMEMITTHAHKSAKAA